MAASPTFELRVAVATSAPDAQIARRVLQDDDVEILPCASLDELCVAIGEGLGAVMVAEELLTSANVDRLSNVLQRQPPWSCVPFIILTRPSWAKGNASLPHARLSGALLIERPVRIGHLLSAIRTSLEARRRQYALRDLLAQAQRAAQERGALQEAAEKSRAAAEAANRMKDEFLAVLSHELRTPLNAIVGWAALLRRKKLDRDQMDRAIESIERNSRLQAQLIDDLLDVSRVISGSLRVESQSVDLGVVVDDAIATVMPTSAAKGVLVERGNRTLAVVRGDSARLQQIVWNLLSNAIKFTPRGGCVRIDVRREAEVVEVKVIDSGEGITADALPHLFQRFWQADSSSTRTRGGLGLGLAIVKSLVELHGGTIEAASEGLGRGAAFTVRLPLALGQASALEAANADGTLQADGWHRSQLSGIRVLVVDDDPESLQVVATALASSGAEVMTASSVAAGLQITHSTALDVIISDIAMPREDGYSFIRKLRGDSEAPAQGSPVIALTAHARSEDRDTARAAGFTAHLAKPVDPAELVRCVAKCRRANET